MASATASVPKGITKLSKLLERLSQHPRLALSGNVKKLRLSLASSNDHWGARHFIQTELPRIRYANPELPIEVIKWDKTSGEHWRPELEVVLEDKSKQAFDLNGKLASSILRELMDKHGGQPWKTAVVEAEKKGEDIIPKAVLEAEEKAVANSNSKTKSTSLPNLWQYLEAHPEKKAARDKEIVDYRNKKDAQRRQAVKNVEAVKERGADAQGGKTPA